MTGLTPFGRFRFHRGQVLAACVDAREPLRLPLQCANCLAESTQAVRCSAPNSERSTILVPYCSRCYRVLEAAKTHIAFAVAASLLLGIAVLVGVPLFGWDIPVWAYVALAFVGGGLPLFLTWTLRPLPLEGQTSRDLAVWWRAGVIVGTNTQWMETLARDNHGQVKLLHGRTRLWTWPTCSGALLLPIVAFALYQLLFPTVAVLNLAAGEFDLFVDGRKKATIGVSSLESADALLFVTVPAGRRYLEARLVADGERVQSAHVNVDAWGHYLFAPGAHGHCFWIESAAYGRSVAKTMKRPLGVKDGFMVLPDHIDTWFAANPPANEDTRSSGGEMVALRHGRCGEQKLSP
jgi:hypothetical protein